MEYRLLGGTGVSVSRLCLGTMALHDATQDEAEGRRIIAEGLDCGVNVIDTADVYQEGRSEILIGNTLAERRDDVVLMTKVRGPMGSGVNERGNSRRWILQEVEQSLRRLRTDWIDVYHIHRPEPYTDIDESLAAMSDLVRAGKVRYIGTSTFSGAQLVESLWVSERRGRERVRVEQPPYSLLTRAAELDVLPTCLRHGIGVVTWSPLAGGWLSGHYVEGQPPPSSTRIAELPAMYDYARTENQAKLRAVTRLARLAAEAGLTLVQLALMFIASHPAVSSIIAGPRNQQQWRSYLSAAEGQLSDDILDEIDRIVPAGVTLNPIDNVGGWQNPNLDSTFRRRPVSQAT